MQNSNLRFTDSIIAALSNITIESYYSKKVAGKVYGSFVLFNEAPGDDILKFELYLIYFIENATPSNHELFKNSLAFCFHNIASTYVKDCPPITYDGSDIRIIYKLVEGYFDFMKNKNPCISEFQYATDLSFNNRLSSIYIIFKYLDIMKFDEHCEVCANVCKLLDSASASRLILMFTLMKDAVQAEVLFNSLFHNLVSIYWNVEVLMLSFTSKVVNTLVHNAFSSGLPSRELYVNASALILSFITQTTLCSNSIVFNDFIVNLLGNYVIKISLYISETQPFVYLENEKISMAFHTPFLSIVFNYCANLLSEYDREGCKFPYSNNIYKKFGFKDNNVIYNKWNVVLSFIDGYVTAVSNWLSKYEEDSHKYYLFVIHSLLDPNLYKWLSNIRFDHCNDTSNDPKCRLGLIFLYIIALYHGIPVMGIHDVAYLRLLYSLPWSLGLNFCANDSLLYFMLPKFLKVLLQTFGNEILLNVVAYFPTSRVLRDATSRELRGFYKPRDYDVDSHFMTLNATSYFIYKKFNVIVEGVSTNCHILEPDAIYSSVCGILSGFLFPPAIHNENAKSNKFHSIQWNWMKQFIWMAYGMNNTLTLLATIDMLICNDIMKCDDMIKDVSRTKFLNRMFISYTAFDSSSAQTADIVNVQKIISTNYIALHQNPLNLLLNIPKSRLLQLFKFRMFGNMFIILLSRLSKYVTEGSSHFYTISNAGIDINHLHLLQEISAINYVVEHLSDATCKETVNQIRNFILTMSSRCTGINEILLSCGFPLNKFSRFIYDQQLEYSIASVTEQYIYYIKLLMTECESSHGWYKDSVRICKSTSDIQRALDPCDLADISLNHLYIITLLSVELGYEVTMSDIEINTNGIENNIKVIIAMFLDCINCKTKDSTMVRFIKNAIPLIIKIHYIYPILCKHTIVAINNWIYEGSEGNHELKNNIVNMLNQMKKIVEEEHKT